MKQTPESIASVVDIMATKLAEIIAAKKNIDKNDAIKELMKTKTYNLLLNQKSRLYAESVEYIFEMIEAEWNNDYEKFLEV